MHIGRIFLLLTGLLILVISITAAVYLVQNQKILKARAGDCQQYTFYVTSVGAVTVINRQTISVPAQSVSIIINGSPVSPLNAPALEPGQSSTIGTVSVPATGKFTWNAIGSYFCNSSGSHL
jgi:hypothetical protein